MKNFPIIAVYQLNVQFEKENTGDVVCGTVADAGLKYRWSGRASPN